MVALKLIKIFDMENEKQRDSCLKEVQLHQVSPKEKIAKHQLSSKDSILIEFVILYN